MKYLPLGRTLSWWWWWWWWYINIFGGFISLLKYWWAHPIKWATSRHWYKTYSRAHSPTFPSLHLRHSSFCNPFRRSTNVTAHSPTLPLLHLRHSSFSNPCFASPTSQDFHLRHLASRPWWRASPDEWSAQCRGHLRDSTNMKDNTHQAHTQPSQQGEYGMMITTAKWYSGTLGA